jgi:hypothetical protein
MRVAAQVGEATADSERFFTNCRFKEILMITNRPIELGKASEETKHMGPHPTDNPFTATGEPLG